MAVINAAGSVFAIAATFTAAATVTAATNATSSVVTAAGHGASVGDYVEIVTGANWGRGERRVFRVSVVATNDITLEGFDTSSTALFVAAGFVGGTLRRVATWTNLSQITPEIEWSGGDLETANSTFLEDVVTKSVPVRRGAETLGLPFFFDPSLAWLATVRTASLLNEYRPFRMTTPGSQKVLLSGLVNLKETPNISDSTLRSRIDVLGQAQATVYAT